MPSRTDSTLPTDQAARDRAIHERARNVIVDAGAGTGKTTLIVARVVELVAPADDAATPLDLERMAVVTFTRKAAGELRLRVRQALLAALGGSKLSEIRHARLLKALGKLDGAFIGTIHSFADRLLRLRPIEARLSPRYRIAENVAPLLRETFQLLMRSAEAGKLPDAVADPRLRERAREVQQTFRDVEQGGLRIEGRRLAMGFGFITGLDRVVELMLLNRDGVIDAPAPPAPDIAAVHTALRSHVNQVKHEVIARDHGSMWLKARAEDLGEALDTQEPLEVLRIVQNVLDRKPRILIMRDDFPHDKPGWEIWKSFWGKDKPLDAGLGHALAPLHDWIGRRVVRAAPVIRDLYDQVKSRHEVVDYLDLLLRLRDLLKQPELHAVYAGLFDHIFVDEFQDTDPLQAEILMYLASTDTPPADWCSIVPAQGRLTIVGDPQQSIYRFRRADILMYRDVCERLEGACRESLVVNFRSRPGLIEWFNVRLAEVLGRDALIADLRFDQEGCQAYYHALEPGPQKSSGDARAHRDLPSEVVEALTYEVPDWKGHPELEAEALARHLWAVCNDDAHRIRDPRDGHVRAPRFGDIAVLTRRTTLLPALFEQFDCFGIPYAARGGNVFLRQPVVVQFILGLRALSDWADGAAQAALHGPPFFALDVADVVGRTQRYEQACEIIAKLRRRRFGRSPAATALALFEDTAFARQVALTPNGSRRLAAVLELISQIDVVAHDQRLGFDAVTATLRSWLIEPERIIDQAAPVEDTAVQVLTTYQAKGLEFPVVALWDTADRLEDKDRPDAWLFDRVAGAWQINIQNFRARSAHEVNVARTEERFFSAERRRLLYVAATRARDLLIVPSPHKDGTTAKADKYACAALLDGQHADGVIEVTPATSVEAVAEFPVLEIDAVGDRAAAEREAVWATARDAARRPLARSVFVSEYVKCTKPVDSEERVPTRQTPQARPAAALPAGEQMQFNFDGRVPSVAPSASAALDTSPVEAQDDAPADEVSRHGPAFGTAVHTALEWIIDGPTHANPDANADVVARACTLAEVTAEDLRRDAATDVERALAALRSLGVYECDDVQLYPEYPVYLPDPEEGLLLRGSIDLLAVGPASAYVIDFKTDTPRPLEALPNYASQIEYYAEAVAVQLPDYEIRAGLLFTANGQLAWAD